MTIFALNVKWRLIRILEIEAGKRGKKWQKVKMKKYDIPETEFNLGGNV